MNDVKGKRNVHSITCKDGTHVRLWLHAKSVDPVYETWYTDTWSVVCFDKVIMCIKLAKSNLSL